MSKSTAGLEFLEDIKITVLHTLCKKGLDIIKAEKIADSTRESILINLPGQNLYIPNLRGLCGKGRRQQVIDLFNSGKKAREIIKLTGLASGTVYDYVRSRNESASAPPEQSGVHNNTMKEIKLHAAKALLQNKVDAATCKEIIEALCIFIQKNWSGIVFSWPVAYQVKDQVTGESSLLSKQERARQLFDDYNKGMSHIALAVKYSLNGEQLKGMIKRMKKKANEKAEIQTSRKN